MPQSVVFPYVPFAIGPSPAFPQGRTALRPVVRVTLANGQQRVACYAIVDSGADNCVFPLPFVQPLGLNPLLASAESTCGVGSYAVPTYFWDIVVHLHGTSISFPVRAGFTDGLNRIGLGLLGQDGYFNRFGVRFDLCRSATFQIEG